MNFLADESIDRQIVVLLRKNGYYVDYVAEMDPGINDKEVLKIARKKRQILLTADKDFGELVYRQKLNTSSIILVRLAGIISEDKAIIVNNAIKKHHSAINKSSFTVISTNSIRIRRVY